VNLRENGLNHRIRKTVSKPPTHGVDPRLLTQLNQLAGGLSPSQLLWAGGYLTGLGSQADALPSSGGGPGNPPLTILYGSPTGHSRPSIWKGPPSGVRFSGSSPVRPTAWTPGIELIRSANLI
jgi:hypothetical protein